MDSALITAAAAGLGSLVGAAASVGTTWMTQRTETVRGYNEWRLREREVLYGEFITEASRLAVDAMLNSLERPDKLVTLYGILGRIRLMSGAEVLHKAEECLHRIVDLYSQPNLTTEQIRNAIEAMETHRLDPLKEFSAVCRTELLELATT
jgi:hypothetical protein